MRIRTLAPLATLAALAVAAPASHAATADATLTGGTLSFINSTPSNVSFPSVTLNGTNQTVSKTQTIDVSDARGTGVGWNITATSTLFTSGSDTLPAGSVTLPSAPPAACDSGVTCTVASGGAVSYPYTLPTSPTTTKMYSAPANTGLGAQTITPNWQLSVPALAKAGSYTSTWTISLVSGP
ncbi:MAG: WxL domain-containing protein [Patulibacter minatonensis]